MTRECRRTKWPELLLPLGDEEDLMNWIFKGGSGTWQNLFKLVWSVNFFGQVEEVDDISGWDDSIFRRFDRAEKKNVIESQ